MEVKPFKKMFQPLKIGGFEIKNRTRMPALSMGYCDNGFVTDALTGFYRERARGGVGLIGLAGSASRLVEPSPHVAVWHDKFIPGLQKLGQVIHDNGAKCYVQIGTGYAWAFGPDEPIIPTPSGVNPIPEGRFLPFRLGSPSRESPRVAIGKGQIKAMVAGWGDSARRIREAGFDGIEIMLAAGYLLCPWISPLTNKRADEYGGPLENRMRIILEIIADIEEKAGPDFPIMCKFSTSDLLVPTRYRGGFVEPGYNFEDAKEMAVMLEKAGVAGFDLVPAWHEGGHSAINYFMPDGAWVYLAQEMKRAVTVPVATGMRIADPWIAEEALVTGKADQISWARPLIADPELPNKIREGRFDDIRVCLVCNRCGEFVDSDLKCQINAQVGHEGDYALSRTAKPKKVFIVGSGAAGMEAARVASLRGHSVVLFEKEKELGGGLRAASKPPMKHHIGQFRDYLVTQIKKLGVEVRLGQEATAAGLTREMPDVIIVATGSREIMPDIPGIGSPHVAGAIDVLLEERETGNEVVIIGAGLIGCETAHYLAGKKGKRVTLVEALPRIGADIARVVRWELLDKLRNAGVGMETDVDVKEITPLGIRGYQKDKVVFYQADTVVVAVGLEADSRLSAELEGKVSEVYTIGDCISPRRIMEAVEEGFHTGRRV